MGRFLPHSATLSKSVAEILRFVRFINVFRRTKRLIWYKGKEEQELDGEHCYQLSMVAWFIVQRHLPHLDLKKVTLYAMVHDLPETYAGDTPAFQDKSGSHGAGPTRATKKRREVKALMRIERDWRGVFPEMLAYLHAYEEQKDEESRFVNALDKFLAEINIFEDNGRTDKELRLVLDEKIAYKRHRIEAHPFLLDLYDDFVRFCRHRPDLFYEPPAAAE